MFSFFILAAQPSGDFPEVDLHKLTLSTAFSLGGRPEKLGLSCVCLRKNERIEMVFKAGRAHTHIAHRLTDCATDVVSFPYGGIMFADMSGSTW